MKDYEQQQKHLEQENFQMKVRIYMLEERLQGNSTPDTDNNMIVDLKVRHRRPAARCSRLFSKVPSPWVADRLLLALLLV